MSWLLGTLLIFTAMYVIFKRFLFCGADTGTVISVESRGPGKGDHVIISFGDSDILEGDAPKNKYVLHETLERHTYRNILGTPKFQLYRRTYG